MTTRYLSALKFLEKLMMLAMGLCFSIILRRYTTPIISIKDLIILILIILTMIRFYFQNYILLDELIRYSNQIMLSAIHMTTIYVVIIVDCLCLVLVAAMPHIYFWYVLELLLFLDAIGFSVIVLNTFQNQFHWNLQWKSTANNLISVILLLVINTLQLSLRENISSQYDILFFGISAIICLLNTVIAFILSSQRFSTG